MKILSTLTIISAALYSAFARRPDGRRRPARRGRPVRRAVNPEVAQAFMENRGPLFADEPDTFQQCDICGPNGGQPTVWNAEVWVDRPGVVGQYKTCSELQSMGDAGLLSVPLCKRLHKISYMCKCSGGQTKTPADLNTYMRGSAHRGAIQPGKGSFNILN